MGKIRETTDLVTMLVPSPVASLRLGFVDSVDLVDWRRTARYTVRLVIAAN